MLFQTPQALGKQLVSEKQGISNPSLQAWAVALYMNSIEKKIIRNELE